MYKVIIVDDEQDIREGMKIIVNWNRLGFKIAAEAENGLEALERMKNEDFDVLFTDIRLPAMNGLQLIEALKSEGIGSKTIVVSAYADFQYARTAMNFGVKKYLLKPLNENEMEEVLLEFKDELDREKGDDLPDEAIDILSASGMNDSSMLLPRIKCYIEDNCCNGINIKNISREFNYNPSYIGRLFSQKEGMNIKDYILKCRINRACQFLMEGHLSVDSIAAETNFKNLNRFYAQFKRIKGCTPKKYKEKMAKGLARFEETN